MKLCFAHTALVLLKSSEGEANVNSFKTLKDRLQWMLEDGLPGMLEDELLRML
jgi:uncharacterized protein YbaR (Trm112 family)